MKTRTKVVLSAMLLLLLVPVLFLLSFYIPAGEPYNTREMYASGRNPLQFSLFAEGPIQLSEEDLTLLANSSLQAAGELAAGQPAAVSKLEVTLPEGEVAIKAYLTINKLFGFLSFPTAVEVKGTATLAEDSLRFTVNSIKAGRLVKVKPATLISLANRFGVSLSGLPGMEAGSGNTISFAVPVDSVLSGASRLFTLSDMNVRSHMLELTLITNTETISEVRSEAGSAVRKLEEKALVRMAEAASTPEEKEFVQKTQSVVKAFNEGRLDEIRTADLVQANELYKSLPTERQDKLRDILNSSMTEKEIRKLEEVLGAYSD